MINLFKSVFCLTSKLTIYQVNPDIYHTQTAFFNKLFPSTWATPGWYCQNFTFLPNKHRFFQPI